MAVLDLALVLPGDVREEPFGQATVVRVQRGAPFIRRPADPAHATVRTRPSIPSGMCIPGFATPILLVTAAIL